MDEENADDGAAPVAAPAAKIKHAKNLYPHQNFFYFRGILNNRSNKSVSVTSNPFFDINHVNDAFTIETYKYYKSKKPFDGPNKPDEPAGGNWFTTRETIPSLIDLRWEAIRTYIKKEKDAKDTAASTTSKRKHTAPVVPVAAATTTPAEKRRKVSAPAVRQQPQEPQQPPQEPQQPPQEPQQHQQHQQQKRGYFLEVNLVLI